MGVLPMVRRIEELNRRRLSGMCFSQYGQAAASFKMHPILIAGTLLATRKI
jgi:hypothetical protein